MKVKNEGADILNKGADILKNSVSLSFFVKKGKIKEKLDIQIFVCSVILGSIIISLINYVFFPLLSNFYKSKSSKSLSEHWHSQTVNQWIYKGIAQMNRG